MSWVVHGMHAQHVEVEINHLCQFVIDFVLWWMPSMHGIWNMKFHFLFHISWNSSFITITPKHIVSSMSSNIIKHFSISYIIQFNNNLEEYVTCYKVHCFYNNSCSFFSLKLECENSSPLLLQHDHVDLILFLVGKTFVAPNFNFSTKYYHITVPQIEAHKLLITKFKFYCCISTFKPYYYVSTNQ